VTDGGATSFMVRLSPVVERDGYSLRCCWAAVVRTCFFDSTAATGGGCTAVDLGYFPIRVNLCTHMFGLFGVNLGKRDGVRGVSGRAFADRGILQHYRRRRRRQARGRPATSPVTGRRSAVSRRRGVDLLAAPSLPWWLRARRHLSAAQERSSAHGGASTTHWLCA
jgi:hypothetical protein